MGSAEWCTNGGTSTWNCLYGGCNVFLVRVIELTGGGLVGVWEVCVPDADEADRWDLYDTEGVVTSEVASRGGTGSGSVFSSTAVAWLEE